MMLPCVKLPLTSGVLKELVNKAKDYTVSHGIVVRTKDCPSTADAVLHAPFTLLPSPVPRSCFQLATEVQCNLNLLMHKVAHDHEFLKDALKNAIKVDEFTRHIWDIYEHVHKEGIEKPVSLGMNRADYMFNVGEEKKPQLRQIECNTMASSFGGLCQQLTEYHRYILHEIGGDSDIKNIPDNKAIDGLAEALVMAWKEYSNTSAVILFFVDEIERNIYDQRFLEYGVTNINCQAKVIRRSIKDIQHRGVLTKDRKLIIDGLEVAVIYQRSGYHPDQFDGEKDWETRLLMERSCAILCPSAAYHLAGTKKVQQVLAVPGVLERYLSAHACAQMRQTFAKLYSLDMGSEGDESVSLAMNDCQQFVLKPQREGGGNNVFGEDIPALLGQIGQSEDRTAYILMERVHPMAVDNYPVISGSPVALSSMVSELGIFGTLVGSRDNILLNKQLGHILRTKTVGTDEGGVATGYSALDSPYLVS